MREVGEQILQMISYCIPVYRPWFARRLIADLIRKTSAVYEILLWLNVDDPEFDAFLAEQIGAGHPVRVIGRTPENIGMAALAELFVAAKHDMITQIDDDVICVSPRIAEICAESFAKYPNVKQLVANVWRDQFTGGARPDWSCYKPFDADSGLYAGPIDGWFSVYHRSILSLVLKMARPRRSLRLRWKSALPRFELTKRVPGRYFYLGSSVQSQLKRIGKLGLLCTRCKVFHVVEPAYLGHFNALEFEIEKYRSLGKDDVANSYQRRATLADPEAVKICLGKIETALATVPVEDSISLQIWAP